MRRFHRFAVRSLGIIGVTVLLAACGRADMPTLAAPPTASIPTPTAVINLTPAAYPVPDVTHDQAAATPQIKHSPPAPTSPPTIIPPTIVPAFPSLAPIPGTLPVGRVAFAAQGSPIGSDPCGANLGIYILNAGESQPTRLADGCAPILSPEGRRIIYAKSEGQLFVIGTDGSQEANLIGAGSGSARNPAWSPDGKRIAFASNRDNSAELYVINADGSQVKRLTNDAGRSALDPGYLTPVWSPDGSRVAFTLGGGGEDIHVVDVDGGGQTRLTDQIARIYGLAWAPDGQSLTFWSQPGVSADLYKISADGSALTRLTDTGAEHPPALWSPDGKRIAFVSYRDGAGELYLMNADGSAQTRLINTPADQLLAWSPDGQYIAFVASSAASSAHEVYILAVDGRQLIRLPITIDGWLTWSRK